MTRYEDLHWRVRDLCDWLAELWQRPIVNERGHPLVQPWSVGDGEEGLIAIRDRFGMMTARNPNVWRVVRRRDLSYVTGEPVGYVDGALRVKCYDLRRQPPPRVYRLGLDDLDV